MCDLDVDLPKLDGGANINEFNLLTFLAEFCKLSGRNARSVNDLLLVALVIGMFRYYDMLLQKKSQPLSPNRASMQVMMFAKWVSTIW